MSTPHIVGIGGTTKPGSSTERALATALAAAERMGATTTLVGGATLATLPTYAPEASARTPAQLAFIDTVRRADGLILATPAYHAGISGLIKNAIDLLEDLGTDERPYLSDRAVGCVVTAHGWQGGGTTLISVRTIVHALRGWPTPLGVTLNTAEALDDKARQQIGLLAAQVVEFAKRAIAARATASFAERRVADNT